MSSEKNVSLSMRVLEGQTGNLRVLIYLAEIGETNFQNISDSLPLTGRSLYSSIDKLKTLGLISSRIDKTSYPPRIMLSLTPKGKEVAEHLRMVENILRR
jgi:DNA-binding HxlR family transcriptional regulator